MDDDAECSNTHRSSLTILHVTMIQHVWLTISTEYSVNGHSSNSPMLPVSSLSQPLGWGLLHSSVLPSATARLDPGIIRRRLSPHS